jgi:prepilin-type N-terminal cleavage/methylation domain-containing protein
MKERLAHMTIRANAYPSPQRVTGTASAQAGFTLFEFAAVMAVSGLLLIWGLSLYDRYVSDKYLDSFYEQQKTVRDSMDDFFAVQARYPCPSRTDVSIEYAGTPGDPNDPPAGVEDCAARSAAVNTCIRGICKRSGARDTPADTDGVNDFILVGAVPFKTLKQKIDATELCYRTSDGQRVPCPPPGSPLPANITRPTDSTTEHANMRAILDVFGYQMTYAVTSTLTDSSTFDPNNGAVGIKTENDESLVTPVGSAHYVLVHHGENNKGAFSSNGVIGEPCTATTADSVNCDKSRGSSGTDGTFLAGIRRMATGATYFDDVVMFQAYAPPKAWRESGTQTRPVLQSANMGNIGIGIDVPRQRLQVGGGMKADVVTVTSFCDASGNNCIRPESLYNPGAACAPANATTYKALEGFNHNAGTETLSRVCFTGNLPRPTITNSSGKCTGASARVVGFTSGGAVICENF